MSFTDIKKKQYIHGVFFIMVMVCLVTFFMLCGPILTPFMIGVLLASIMNPALHFAERRLHIHRSWSAFALTVLSYCFLLSLFFLVAPAPKKIYHFFDSYDASDIINKAQHIFDFLPATIRCFFYENTTKIVWAIWSMISGHIVTLFHNGIAATQVIVNCFITPIIAFYFMRDGKKIYEAVQQVLPRSWQPMTTSWIEEVYTLLVHYCRGQFLVCSIIALFYSTIFIILGLEYGFLWGIFSGFMLIIPYVGIFMAWMCVLISAAMQWGLETYFFLTCATYIIGYVLEAFFVTPYLLGRNTGVHPLWIFFFIFCGAFFHGIVGMLMALPLGMVLTATWRFLRNNVYIKSALYRAPSLPFSFGEHQ